VVKLGYHASHEQFAPSELLQLVQHAEQAGFACAKSSDHFHPWSEAQGNSGFAWSWLGAAMQATEMPFGMISTPGYRYHPAVLAQAAATIAEMFPDRLWLALGSGEAINEAVTGLPWPDKAERNARLKECVDIIRALFSGETVTHRGRVMVSEAKLYSRPARPVPLYGAAVTEATARFVGGWAEGLLTVTDDLETVRRLIAAFREGGGGSKPVVLQAAFCWSEDHEEATEMAMDQWRNCVVGGEVRWDLRRPADFDLLGLAVTSEFLRQRILVTDDVLRLRDWLRSFEQLGVTEIYLHQVGRNQRSFIDAFQRLSG
jgi:coenzyme F420-dependent glucose-6-phosphate dehydrogenase